MNTTSQNNADLAIKKLSQAFEHIRDIEIFFNIGICDKAKNITSKSTAIRNCIDNLMDLSQELKLDIRRDYDSIEFAIEDADHERC